jgi:hypothetical protein
MLVVVLNETSSVHHPLWSESGNPLLAPILGCNPFANKARFTKNPAIDAKEKPRPAFTVGIAQLIAAQTNVLVLKSEPIETQRTDKSPFLCPPAQAEEFTSAVVGMENWKDKVE